MWRLFSSPLVVCDYSWQLWLSIALGTYEHYHPKPRTCVWCPCTSAGTFNSVLRLWTQDNSAPPKINQRRELWHPSSLKTWEILTHSAKAKRNIQLRTWGQSRGKVTPLCSRTYQTPPTRRRKCTGHLLSLVKSVEVIYDSQAMKDYDPFFHKRSVSLGLHSSLLSLQESSHLAIHVNKHSLFSPKLEGWIFHGIANKFWLLFFLVSHDMEGFGLEMANSLCCMH